MAVRNLEKRWCYSQMMNISMGTKTAPIRAVADKKSAWTQMECMQCRQTTDRQLFSLYIDNDNWGEFGAES